MLVKSLSRILLLSLALAGGCATSTGVLKLGPDTYKMTSYRSPIRGGATAAEEEVIVEANKHCEAMGRQVYVHSSRSLARLDGNRGSSGFEAIFQCLSDTDPRLKQSNADQSPAIIIKEGKARD
jgi:hypothetical protein